MGIRVRIKSGVEIRLDHIQSALKTGKNIVFVDLNARDGFVPVRAQLHQQRTSSATEVEHALVRLYQANDLLVVQARVVSSGEGDATAKAAVGMGSTTIESVRMIAGEDVIYDMP